MANSETNQPAATGPVTPENQALVTARALAGKLSDKQRADLKWLGFEVPAARSLYTGAKWSPPAAPAPGADDLAALHAGAHGPATGAQVYELAPASPLRLAYDLTPNNGGARHYATLYAAGRSWRVSGNVWERYASMTDRQVANSARRAKLEAERTQRKNKALADKVEKDGPLTALFYGTPEPAKPRYTTAQEAEQHERQRRQSLHEHHRQFRAKQTRNIRQQLAALSEAEVAHFYTSWQRRPGGYGLEYLLSALHELAKRKAQAAVEQPAEPVQLETSRPAGEGWHVITRPVDVAPEHLTELEQLRELVQAMPTGSRAPSLYEVVQLAQQLPAGSPYHVEGRPDGLAIGYGPVEVLRLAPAGSWPAPSSNYPPPRSQRAAPIGSGYVPPRVAPVRPASRAQVRLLATGGLEIYLPSPET